MTASSPPPTPPGWYPDHSAPSMMRWWDGHRWTETVAPAPPRQPGPASSWQPAAPGAPYGLAGPQFGPWVSPDEAVVRRLADYEQYSGWFWIALGCLQVLSVVGIIAGIWNIFAGSTRLKVSKMIRLRDPRIPHEFQGAGGLVVIAVINVFLGGVIGIIGVAADVYIRDQVLKNAYLFNQTGQGVRSA